MEIGRSHEAGAPIRQYDDYVVENVTSPSLVSTPDPVQGCAIGTAEGTAVKPGPAVELQKQPSIPAKPTKPIFFKPRPPKSISVSSFAKPSPIERKEALTLPQVSPRPVVAPKPDVVREEKKSRFRPAQNPITQSVDLVNTISESKPLESKSQKSDLQEFWPDVTEVKKPLPLESDLQEITTFKSNEQKSTGETLETKTDEADNDRKTAEEQNLIARLPQEYQGIRADTDANVEIIDPQKQVQEVSPPFNSEGTTKEEVFVTHETGTSIDRDSVLQGKKPTDDMTSEFSNPSPTHANDQEIVKVYEKLPEREVVADNNALAGIVSEHFTEREVVADNNTQAGIEQYTGSPKGRKETTQESESENEISDGEIPSSKLVIFSHHHVISDSENEIEKVVSHEVVPEEPLPSSFLAIPEPSDDDDQECTVMLFSANGSLKADDARDIKTSGNITNCLLDMTPELV